MKQEKKPILKLIAIHRLDAVTEIILKHLESGKEIGKQVAEIKKRTKSHRIEITRKAKDDIIILLTQKLHELLEDGVSVVHIKGNATIDSEAIRQGMELRKKR